jgi:uncharacterized repeat protein (TIGR03803 family)
MRLSIQATASGDPLAGTVPRNLGAASSGLGGALLPAVAAAVILTACSGGGGTASNSVLPGVPGSVLAQAAARSNGALSPDAVTYTSLYSFKGGSDGTNPYAGLVDVNGTLYGTTEIGGTGDDGTVFSITTSGAESVLHSFAGGSDGAYPWAGLTDVNGTLFGTENGGVNNLGTVFSITTSGTERILHTFTGPPDGQLSYAGLVDVDGTLYGTTQYGGTGSCGGGCGTVFKITTSGAESVIYSFTNGSDGGYPYAGLLNVKGTLYGTTQEGGASDAGTVFSITTSGKESVLHSFTAGLDGAEPYAGLVNLGGTLYGTTNSGGASNKGTVFSITLSGTETVLHSFTGGSDGGYPYAGLLNVNGTLYGTTAIGGTSKNGGRGTVFKITKAGKESVVYRFQSAPDGANPYAGLIDVGGTLYGTTLAGGASGAGTVFSIGL